MANMNEQALENRIAEAIRGGDVETTRRLLAERPGFIHRYHEARSWLQVAAYHGRLPMIHLLISLGCDVNAADQVGDPWTPLDTAISEDNPGLVRVLLENGAKVNRDREVIMAVAGNKKHSLEMVRLLEQYGADLHRVFMNEVTGEPMNALSTALDWETQDVVAYLKSKGAQVPPKPAGKSVDKNRRNGAR
jgi:ankyrin repeat protein